MLETGRLEPPPIRGALQEVVGVLPLVVHGSGTRSLPLSSHCTHSSTELDLKLTDDLKSSPAPLYQWRQLRSDVTDG